MGRDGADSFAGFIRRSARRCGDVDVQRALSAVSAELFGTQSQPIRLGRYELCERLGQGGCGIVYRAYDPALDRHVAVKLLHGDAVHDTDDQAARLRQEAQAIARLTHPNVVEVFDVGVAERAAPGVEGSSPGGLYFVMELVDGPTLGTWLKQSSRSQSQIIEAFAQAARGLAAAHDAGIVHRDFKPDNVLIGEDGRPRVADFGVARMFAQLQHDPVTEPSRGAPDPARLRITATGALVGTPIYMAPEQLTGTGADPRSDQYAWGLALYEALAGRRPFAAGSAVEVLRLKESGPPPPIAGVPRRINQLLATTMAPDPAGRLPSMTTAVRQLGPRRRWPVPVLAAVSLVGGVVAWPAASDTDARCRDVERSLSGVWGPEQSAAATAVIDASGVPTASWASQRVRGVLDAYAEAWSDAYRQACHSPPRGTDRDLVLDCLDRRRGELAAVMQVLTEADASVVRRASSVVDGLSPLEQCHDLRTLRARPQAATPETAIVGELRDRIADARAEVAAGRYEHAVRSAADLVAASRAVGFAPVQAEAALVWAQALDRLGRYPAAQAAAEQAIRVASESGHDEVAAQAAALRLRVIGWRMGRADEALAEQGHARAAARRVGVGSEAEGDFFAAIGALHLRANRAQAASDAYGNAVDLYVAHHADTKLAGALNGHGAALFNAGDDRRAQDAFERSLRAYHRSLGTEHPSVAVVHHNLANVYRREGEQSAALEHERRSLEVSRAAFGSTHPDVALALDGIADCLVAMSRNEEALEAQRDALEIFERVHGPRHHLVAGSLSDLATVLGRTKRFADAEHYFDRAIELNRSLGDHRGLGVTLTSYAGMLLAMGRHTEARDAGIEAAAAFAEVSSPSDPQVGPALFYLGVAHAALGEHALATASLAAMIRRYEGVYGPGHTLLGSPVAMLGLVELRSGRPRKAVTLLERGAGLLAQDDESTRGSLVEARIGLVRALVAIDAPNERLRDAVRKAQALCLEHGTCSDEDRELLDQHADLGANQRRPGRD